MSLILDFEINAVPVPMPLHVSDFTIMSLILVFEINAVLVLVPHHVPRHVSYSVLVPCHVCGFSI